MLELRNVSFYYEEKHKILDHVSLSFSSHGLVMIEGESGSGKSTLLSLLHHEKEVKEGDILFFHQSLNEMNEQEKMDYRLFSCGVVYQDYGLFSHLSIEENLKMFMFVVNKNEDIPTLLKKVGLSIDPKTNVDVLSGGEKQRVAIARSMIFSSPILLLDEPTSSLDDYNAFEIMDLLKELSKKSLIIIVTHDQRIIENGGLLISEYSTGSTMTKFNYPQRDRIQSKLSEIILIIQANDQSGTMIATRNCLKDGKRVYAIKGNRISIVHNYVDIDSPEELEEITKWIF